MNNDSNIMVENKGLRLNRRDFLKASAAAGLVMGLGYFASKYNFNIFVTRDAVNDEELQPGWQYSYVPSICAFCSSTCDILVETEYKNGYMRALEIDGNPLSPLNEGKVCPRGRAGIFRTYNVDRLKTPLIRTGPKGTWSFREATWEEAINYIMQNIKQLNPQPYEFLLIGGGIPCANYKPYFIPFTLGTQIPNINGTPMQTCLFSDQVPIGFVIGGFDLHATDMMDDMTYSSLIVAWGTSGIPAGIFVNRAIRYAKGIENGAYVIAIDPRMSEAASKANLWIPAKPGSDLYIAMAIINYLIQNNYYDDEFVRYYTNAPFLAYKENDVVKLLEEDYDDGTVKAYYVYDEISGQIVEVPPFTNTNKYDVNGNFIKPALNAPQGLTYNGKQVQTVFQFLAQKVSNYTLEYAAQVADVPLSQLQELAFRIATMKPMTIITGLKGFFNDQAVQFRKAYATIMALTGNIDIRGGWVYSAVYREGIKKVVNAYNNMVSSGKTKPGILLQRPEVLEQLPVNELPGAFFAMFPIIYVYNNPSFWITGVPALSYAYNQVLKQQGKKPAGAYTLFEESGSYAAIKGQVTWNGQPYKPKVAMSYGGSPFNFKWDEYKQVLETTFYIMIDILPTEASLYADVILPDVTYLERDEFFWDDGPAMDRAIRGRWQTIPVLWPNTANGLDLFIMFAYMLNPQAGDAYIQWMARFAGVPLDILKSVIQQEMPNYQQYLMKNNGYPPWGSFTAKAWREAQLSVLSEELNMPKEQILQTLRNNGVIVIKIVDDYFANHERIPWDLPAATPTGRIEIYSTILYYYVIQNYGYDPVWDPIIAEIPPNWNGGYAVEDGVYHSPPTPYNDPTFKPTLPELFFIEYKIPQFAYTSSADNPLLMAITSNSYHKDILMRAWINPTTAAQLGINEGDWIAIERWKLPNPDGSIPKLIVRAHLTQWIRPDTIGVPEPFGQRNPALTTATKAVNEFGNQPVSVMWAPGRNPLGGYHMNEQFTVRVRKATSDEIQAATQLASVQTPDTLPSQQAKVTTPNNSASQNDWQQYVSYGNVSTLG
ncbi:Anaerobic dehydrogenase, typically selenocysteine-containing [Sulfolobus islandicus LAL14/1]|uniref:Anaerobic dehydrogenase, typically selenocysteine-containing n=4 Tax=Saccharolobus islandicus TaxID=43080 RepID=M9U7G6_SACIS|nr:Anaerobic dehydrogenase, typically selenocysteine-containing [Sulfolobus islandicus LAL14/1]